MDNNNNSNNNTNFSSWEEQSGWFVERKKEISNGNIPKISAEEQKRNAIGEKRVEDDRLPIEPRKAPIKKKGTVKQINKHRTDDEKEEKPVLRKIQTGKGSKKKSVKRTSARLTGKKSGSLERGKRSQVVRSKDDERIAAQEQKKIKKVIDRAKGTALAVLIVAVIGLALCMFFAFKTSNVVVEGKTKYKADEIISASGICTGDYVWKINKNEVERTVCKIYPYIGNVKVSVKLPSTVKLIVTAAKEKYAIPYGKNYVIVDDNGKVLNRTEKKVPEGAVVLSGVSFANDNVGDTIVYDEKSEGKPELADTVIAKAKAAGIEPITEVNVDNPTAIYAVYDARVKLYFGNQSDLDAKMRSCKGLLDKLSSESKNFTGVANLSNNGKVYFLPGSIDAEVTSAKKYEMQMEQKEKTANKEKK